MSQELPPRINTNHRRATRSSAFEAMMLTLGSSGVEAILGMLRGIIVMNQIGPTGRGIMRMVGMIHRYLTHSHLGILHGMSKELPQAIGRDDTADAEDIENVGATWVLISAILCGFGMVLFAYFADEGYTTRLSIMAGGGILIAMQTYALYRITLRAWQRFPTLSTGSVVNTTAEFGLIIGGCKFLRTIGGMLGWLIADILTILFYKITSGFTIKWKPDPVIALRLMKTGFPIAMIILSDTMLRTVDGMVVATGYSLTSFGLYSVAMQMATYIYSIPESAGFVMMPRIIESHAADGESAELRRQVILPTHTVATIMPIAAGLAYILLPPLIRTVVPKFESCIFSAQTLSLASVLLGLPMVANSLLTAINKESWVVFNKCLGAAIIYLLARHEIDTGGSLRNVALCAGAGYFVSSTLSLWQVFSRYTRTRGEFFLEMALCYLPFAWSLGALLLSGRWLQTQLDPYCSDWWRAAARVMIFMIFSIPVLIYGDRRTGLFKRFKNIGNKIRSKLFNR